MLSAQPSAKAQARARASFQRFAAQQKPQRLSDEDILAACPDSIVTWDTNDDGELVRNTKTVFIFDSQKRLSIETDFAWEDGAWVLESKDSYSYYDNSDRVDVLYHYSENGFFSTDERTHFTYVSGTDNVWTATTEMNDGTGNWVYSSRVTYTYDEQGRPTLELTEGWEDGKFVNSEKLTTVYEGEKATSTNYEWNGLEWAAVEYSISYVNAQGMPYREESYEQDEETGEFMLSMVTELTYDANGMPVSMKMLYDLGGGEVLEVGSGAFVYEYNAQGLPTKVTTTMHIDFFGMFSEDTTTITYYYYGDDARVDNAAVEPAVTARRYYGMDGKETTGAVRGLYIVVTEYADGTRTAVKSVRR